MPNWINLPLDRAEEEEERELSSDFMEETEVDSVIEEKEGEEGEEEASVTLVDALRRFVAKGQLSLLLKTDTARIIKDLPKTWQWHNKDLISRQKTRQDSGTLSLL